MIKSPNETMRSYVFASDELCVNAGVNEGSSHDGTLMNEADCFQARYDEYLSDEDQIELLQQKEFISSLFYRGDCFNEIGEDKFVINADNDKLLLMNGQVRRDGHIVEVFAEMRNQDSILMKVEKIVKIVEMFSQVRCQDCGMSIGQKHRRKVFRW